VISGKRQKPLQKAARWPCGVCGRGVGSNSIQCTSCHKWVHKRCGIKGSMYKVMRSFICRGCSNPVISTGDTSVDIGASANLEVVDKLCYLSDMLSADGMCCEKKDTDWVKECMEYEVEGSRPRGRPKRTWKEVVQKDCQAHNLNKEDAMDRGRWKKMIKIG